MGPKTGPKISKKSPISETIQNPKNDKNGSRDKNVKNQSW